MNHRMLALSSFTAAMLLGAFSTLAQNPIHVTYLWHMHQPVYYPYESVGETDAAGRFNFSVAGVHNDRAGNYTSWPKDAVQQGADRNMAHAGAQCSFSGSLGENLNGMGFAGGGWYNDYRWARNGLKTSLNNPRLDMVGIAYHHSLMPLTCKESMLMQIRLHKEAYKETWDTTGYSKGFWPPECAFSETIIPALVEEGLEWVIVDNGHFDRACQNYPWVDATSIRPNPADQLNPDPATIGSQWVQLNNVWAPSKVSAPWGYQPHYVKYVDPATGVEKKIVAVPAARYEGNENGRGGYGSFKPQNVWGAHASNGVNNDPNRPMLILCHSDGDNYGMKNYDAWHAQHGLFLDMCQSDSRFESTGVQDYLQMYPVPTNDVIHVEPGSWIGIDGGTPYFDKWRENNAGFRGDPNEHPDFWSWSVIVAAQNRVIHADQLENSYSMNDVQWGIGPDTARAWHFYLQGETSCHWYWDYDRDNPWDGNTTRACNLAITEANKVIARHAGNDPVGPSIFPPQRNIYNPGGKHWNEAGVQPSDFQVWTFIDDVNGVAQARLFWRADNDGQNPLAENDNEVYARNAARVGAWNQVNMTNSWYPANRGPQVPSPANRAMKYDGSILGQNNVLIDYYVEAVDGAGKTNRSDIMHVFVGVSAPITNNLPVVTVTPEAPEVCKPITFAYNPTNRPLQGITPIKIQLDWEPSVSAPVAMDMTQSNGLWYATTSIPDGQTNVVFYFHNGAGIVDDNTNQSWSAAISACSTGPAQVVEFNPAAPDGCGTVTVSYSPNYGPLKNATNVFIHIGFNGWQGVAVPNPAMSASGTGTWTYVYDIPDNTYIVDCVFNNGSGAWDNNQGADYHVAVTNCAQQPVAGIVITNPVSDTSVPSSTTNIQIAGLASTNLAGHLQWSNSLTGVSGSIPMSTTWSLPLLSLGGGTNVISVSGSNVTLAGSTVAQDQASNEVYASGWDQGDNGGTGWGGGWTLGSSGNGGHFRASGATNLSVGPVAWGLWANGGGLADAVRPFATDLQPGQKFSLGFDNNWISVGAVVGIALQNAGGSNLLEFFFVGGATNYVVKDSLGDRDTGRTWTGDGLQLEFEVLGPSAYKFTHAGNAMTGTLIQAADQGVRRFRVFNFNSGAGGEYDLFINNLRIEQVSVTAAVTGDTVSVIRLMDEYHDGIPMSWWNRYGLGAGQSAAGHEDADGASNWEEYIADTNPTNSASVFTSRVFQAQGAGVLNLVVGAPTTNSRRYDVWRATNLFNPVWSPLLLDVPGAVDGAAITLSVTNGGVLEVYRTGVKLP